MTKRKKRMTKRKGKKGKKRTTKRKGKKRKERAKMVYDLVGVVAQLRLEAVEVDPTEHKLCVFYGLCKKDLALLHSILG